MHSVPVRNVVHRGAKHDQNLFVRQVRCAYLRVNQETHDGPAAGPGLGLVDGIDAEGGIPL